MALVTAFLPTDMTNLGFTSVAPGIVGYQEYTNATYNGIVYANALEIDYVVSSVTYSLVLAGSGFVYGATSGTIPPVITSGTVTGILLQKYVGSGFTPDVYIQNFSALVSAADSVLLGNSLLADLNFLQSTVFTGNDTIIGSSGNDVLVGYGANDVFTGGGGSNSITGTAGSNNVVVYTGNFASYTIIQGTSSFTVTYNGNGGGTDTLTDIQTLKFADKTVSVASLPQAANVLASQAAGEQANAAVTSFTVADTAANVASVLASLSTDNKLSSITLTDGGTPIIQLTTVQQSADAVGLSKITSPYVVLNPVTLSVDNGTYLVQLGTKYYLETSGGSGPALSINGVAVTSGEFGDYAPYDAVAVTGGYEVALRQASTGNFVVWNVNSAGNFTSLQTGIVTSTASQLEALETVFNQDLNGDGTIGVKTTVLSTDFGTVFESVGNTYAIIPSGGSAVTVKYNGAAITTGQFGAYNPIGAVVFVNGYEVAFRSSVDGSVVLWQVDANGNFQSVASGVLSNASTTLQADETTFGQDLNADGTLGIITSTIITNGTTTLLKAGNEYQIKPSVGSAVTLRANGSPVTSTEFGDYTPVSVVAVQGGYEVAFKSPSSGDFIVWYVDSVGNYTSLATGVVADASFALENQELVFGQDLNGDGTTGVNTTTVSTGTGCALLQMGNSYLIQSTYTSTNYTLTYNGSPVTAGEFADYLPTAVATVSGGYIVVFTQTSTGNIVVWDVNAGGAFVGLRTGVIASSSQTFENLETLVYTDLNGDGVIGTAGYASDSSTTPPAVVEETQYSYLINDNGSTVALQYGGNYLNVGQLGDFNMTAAVSVSNGFDVAFRSASSGNFVVWNVDSSGAFIKLVTGVVGANSYQIESLETVFNRDLNGDGTIGVTTKALGTANGTTLTQIADSYVINNATSPQTLQLNGTNVAAGEFGAYAPVYATAVTGGFDVAFKAAGVDSYVVWRTDVSGNYQGLLTGVVTGESFAIEQLQSTFKLAISGDTALRSTVVTNVASSDLTSSPSTTVQLLGNSAFATYGGLSQSTLSISGTVGAVSLSTQGMDTIEFTLAPSSGIETINNFRYTVDELNIDLAGAGASVLQATDTQLNGAAAIALYSSADTSHGIVLTGLGSGMNAANLLFNHTTYAGGHALIS